MKIKILVAFLSICLSSMAFAGSCGSGSCQKDKSSDDSHQSSKS